MKMAGRHDRGLQSRLPQSEYQRKWFGQPASGTIVTSGSDQLRPSLLPSCDGAAVSSFHCGSSISINRLTN